MTEKNTIIYETLKTLPAHILFQLALYWNYQPQTWQLSILACDVLRTHKMTREFIDVLRRLPNFN